MSPPPTDAEFFLGAGVAAQQRAICAVMTLDDRRARLDAAAALRALNHAFVAHNRDIDGLRALQRTATREANAMRSGVVRDRAAMSQESLRTPDSEIDSGFEDRAVAGRGNPTAAVVEIHEEGPDGLIASVVLGPAYCSFPGRAHGGIVCAVFDDITGFAIRHLGEPAFTGELTVRYLAPVPLGERLEISARFDGRERRKLFVSEEMRFDGGVVATCRATCITPASQ
jgi:acyl-coenzyme A thioesterase PaaI-like protein